MTHRYQCPRGCGFETHSHEVWMAHHCGLTPEDEKRVAQIAKDMREGIELSALGSKPADPVNHPPHYTAHPSGVECVQVTEHMGFCLGNAVKYIWRADLKGNAIQDLEKARWYIDREIDRRKRAVQTAQDRST